MKKLADQLAEIKRELGKRKYFYPEWIRIGRIKADVAAHRIECMECTAELLERQIQLEEAGNDLFKRAELAQQRDNVTDAVNFGKGL